LSEDVFEIGGECEWTDFYREAVAGGGMLKQNIRLGGKQEKIFGRTEKLLDYSKERVIVGRAVLL
jgi:hypothetical protein